MPTDDPKHFTQTFEWRAQKLQSQIGTLMAMHTRLAAWYKEADEKKSPLASSYKSLLLHIEAIINQTLSTFQGRAKDVTRAIQSLRHGVPVLLSEHGDVTIDVEDSPLARTLQNKVCRQSGPGAVDAAIGAAAYQISGAKGEIPRENDHRVIDISIMDPSNPWPYPSKPRPSHPPLEEWLRVAQERVRTHVLSEQPEKGLTPGTQEWCKDVGRLLKEGEIEPTLGAPSRYENERVVFKCGAKEERFNYIQVNIAFMPNTTVAHQNKDVQLESAVFAVIRVRDEFLCHHTAYRLHANGKFFVHRPEIPVLAPI